MDLIKPIDFVVSCKFRNFLLVIDSNCVAPIFQGGDLCVIMENNLIKPIASVFPCKFRNFLLVIHSNCVTPVFQGVDLCVIMENGPHKTHCLSGFMQISEFFACNLFKLCGPRFPRG